VATVHDTTAANPTGVIETTEPAGLPRVGISPGSEEMGAANSFPIGAGGVGTTFMMPAQLARAGHTKIAMIHVDTPAIQALSGVLEPMLDAYGAELTTMIPVPQGTTDYQQFILAAQDSGATGVMLPLGEAEAVQVIRAAEQLGSDLEFAVSQGTFGQADAEDLGDFAEQMLFNSELPPVTASLDRWPILGDVVADLSASGKPELQRDQVKSSSFRSWLAVYALVQVVEQFGDPDDVSREAITEAFESARDIDMFELIPALTPRGGTGEGILGAVSAKTAAAFDARGWSTLGDIGHLDEDGYLYLTDRGSNMIISGGVNVYPREVEDVLVLHPAVADAAVIGVPHPDLGETVRAVVQRADAPPDDAPPDDVADGDGDALADELIAYCRARIAHFKCPTSVVFVDALPRLPSGKLAKRLLPDDVRGSAP
jgi:hypothetical protein